MVKVGDKVNVINPSCPEKNHYLWTVIEIYYSENKVWLEEKLDYGTANLYADLSHIKVVTSVSMEVYRQISELRAKENARLEAFRATLSPQQIASRQAAISQAVAFFANETKD